MKKYLFLVLLVFNYGISQVNSNGTLTPNITGQNPFFDASTNFDNSIVPDSNGKGLVFPRTDLTTWQFNTEQLDGITFPSAFDGMIVYNIGTGTTLSGQGQVISVSPGFYYFSNPGASTAITNGTWVKIGAQVPQGTQGVAGSNGATWTSGSGVPSNTLGSNGDYYLNTTTSDVYLKTANVYSVITNIRGAAGATGATGPAGSNASVTGTAPISVSDGVISIDNAGITTDKIADGAIVNADISDSAAIALSKMENLAANSVIANTSASAATPTAIGMTSAATANNVAIRDSNANLYANNFINSFYSRTTGSTPISFTVISKQIQEFKGTVAQTITLPTASTLTTGHHFIL